MPGEVTAQWYFGQAKVFHELNASSVDLFAKRFCVFTPFPSVLSPSANPNFHLRRSNHHHPQENPGAPLLGRSEHQQQRLLLLNEKLSYHCQCRGYQCAQYAIH